MSEVISAETKQERIKRLSRFLAKEVLPGPKPPTEQEKRYMYLMGVLSLLGFLAATLFLGLFVYNLLGALIVLGRLADVFEAGRENQAMSLALAISLQRGLPVLILLAGVYRSIAVWRVQQADLQRRQAVTDAEDLEIDPVIDRSWSARLLRVADYLPLTGLRFFLEALYPAAYVQPTPYAYPVGALLALIAEKKEIETELIPSGLAGMLPEPNNPLVVREAIRLALACDLVGEKASLNTQGREIRRMQLLERGSLLVKRFELLPATPS